MADEHLVNEVNLKTVSFLEWLSLAWSLVWRSIILAIGSMITAGIIGGIVGFIIGFVTSMIGIDVETITPFLTIIGGVIGLFIGVCFTILVLKWMFKTKFNRFRLTLVELDATNS